MKNLKILLSISALFMSAGMMYSDVNIGEHTKRFVGENVRRFAQQFMKQSTDEFVTLEFLQSMFPEENLDNLLSSNGQQFLVGAVQAEVDQGLVGFDSSLRIKHELVIKRDEQGKVSEVRAWIQKHQAKIVNHLNKKNLRKINFEVIKNACESLKIKLPAVLSDQDKKDIVEEITIAINLSNPGNIKASGEKFFDAKQYKYIQEYLIPKLQAAGYSSISADEFENFLDNLPNKSFTGTSIENTFAKFSHHRKGEFVDMLSALLADSVNQQIQRLVEQLSKINRSLPISESSEENAR